MTRRKTSALVNTQAVWCGDCEEQLRRLPYACGDLVARDKRPKGFFGSFDYSEDALRKADAQFRATGRIIIPLTVKDILEEHLAKRA